MAEAVPTSTPVMRLSACSRGWLISGKAMTTQMKTMAACPAVSGLRTSTQV